MLALVRYLLAVLAVLTALPALGQEVIRSFETVIVVHEDASVTITETIMVNAEGVDIRRGIFRDIPTVLIANDGSRVNSNLEVLEVTRDGRAESYSLESIRDGERIRIGNPDMLLKRGTHRYQIRYTMDRAARMFPDHDELYWNATGNFWMFPIQTATTTVTLPNGARIVDINVFTGSQGSKAANGRAEKLSDRQARFTLTRGLAPYEGMTVAVAFEKGVLIAPQGVEGLKYWFSDNRNTLVPSFLVLLALVYNFSAWLRVGRDPAKGVIFPRFYPPEDFSPALTHYVHRMGWQNGGWLAFSSALVSLATKGLIEIDKVGKKTVLRTLSGASRTGLPAGEAVIFNFLEGQREIVIDQKTGPALDTTRESLLRALESENREVYFRNHTIFVVFGVFLALCSLAAMAFLKVLDIEMLMFAGFCAVFTGAYGFALRTMWKRRGLGRIVFLVIFAIVSINMGTLIIESTLFNWVDFPFIAAASIIVITLIFGILMRAPTVHGRKVMDEIDGFKMYLETAEKERLNFQDEPEMSVTRFERILPYAMALGVEKPWSERFQADLARNAVTDSSSYSPSWYHDQSFSPSSFSRSMSTMASGLTSAMIAAQPAKSSDSGFSGGGGSSGGGGGGGGGGGW